MDSGKELSSTQKRGVYHANNARTQASQMLCYTATKSI